MINKEGEYKAVPYDKFNSLYNFALIKDFRFFLKQDTSNPHCFFEELDIKPKEEISLILVTLLLSKITRKDLQWSIGQDSNFSSKDLEQRGDGTICCFSPPLDEDIIEVEQVTVHHEGKNHQPFLQDNIEFEIDRKIEKSNKKESYKERTLVVYVHDQGDFSRLKLIEKYNNKSNPFYRIILLGHKKDKVNNKVKYKVKNGYAFDFTIIKSDDPVNLINSYRLFFDKKFRCKKHFEDVNKQYRRKSKKL